MDTFIEALASRASSKIGTGDDFKIVVTQAYYPIGTVMRVSSTIPIEYVACIPPAASHPRSAAVSLFPEYSLTKAVAVDLGLDNEAIKKLVDFGVSVKDNDTITLSIKAPQIETLADNGLKDLISKAECRQSLPDSEVWVVRGYILGQRNFLLKGVNSAVLKGQVQKLGTFNMSRQGDASLAVTDSEQVGFLQIVSQVRAKPAAASAPVAISKPSVANVMGRIYVQQDKLDRSGTGKLVVEALKAAALGVENVIEPVKSSSMPKQAQVRYFNEPDRALANQALVQLQKYYPGATAVLTSLPAPRGQLEVWLPKAGL